MILRLVYVECSVMTPAGTARAKDPLGKAFFLTKSAEAVPAAGIHRYTEHEPPPDT